jgi:prepilin-type N-terminal cleavage/methylation domain-containing protein
MKIPRYKKTKGGFTLAEVLITLAIIGVVAALTIPTVISNYQERQTITSLKKFYTEISQAYARAQVDNGTPDTWDWGTSYNSASSDKIISYLAPYLKINKRCGTVGGCFSSDQYKTLNKNINWASPNATNGGYASAQLSNGLAFWVNTQGSGCTTDRGVTKGLSSICGNIGVDLNGYKKPNQLGRDTFYFYLTKYNVIPMGTKDETMITLTNQCKTSSQDQYNGYACTAWILAKDNMDYLHRDVSW